MSAPARMRVENWMMELGAAAFALGAAGLNARWLHGALPVGVARALMTGMLSVGAVVARIYTWLP
jgi:hypothetical protein